MDNRIVELLHLLPRNLYEKCLLVGTPVKTLIEGLQPRVGKIDTVSLAQISSYGKGLYDLVFCYIPQYPTMQMIAEVTVAARLGGTIVFLVPSVFLGALRMKKTAMVLSIYGLSPSLDDIRLAVPLMNRACTAAALALYQPSLLKARLRKFIAYSLARVGLSSVWLPWMMVIGRKGDGAGIDGLQGIIEKLFGNDIQLALFTGTPGHLRKPTLQVMNNAGTILGYCKIGGSPYTKTTIENEAFMLRHLADLDLGDTHIPAVLFAGDIGQGTTILIQSTIKQHLSAAPLSPEALHDNFLFKLFSKTRYDCRFCESACFEEVTGRITALKGFISAEHWMGIHKAFGRAASIFDMHHIPLCLAHRDFTPWNTFLSNEQLYVFDWEFGRTSWVPLTDAFHFVLQKGVLVDHETEETLWQRITDDSLKEGKFLKRCASMPGTDRSVYYSLLTFYLVDNITTYLIQQKEAGQEADMGMELLNVWWRLFLRARQHLKG